MSLTPKPFNMKAVIKELQTIPELTEKIYGIYDDEIDDDSIPDKPYIFVNIVTDIPTPEETTTRIEFRIISPANKQAEGDYINKQALRDIDAILVSKIPNIHLFNNEFNVYNIAPDTGTPLIEDEGRVSFIREFLFYFIN